MNRTVAHQALIEAIRKLVAREFQRKVVLFKCPIGFGYTERGAPISFGKKGFPDLFGLVTPTGRFIGIEVKTGKGQLRKPQRTMRDALTALGGLWYLGRSVEGVRVYLRQSVNEEKMRHALRRERIWP